MKTKTCYGPSGCRMCHDVTTDWFLRVCLKEGCAAVDLCHHLIRHHDSHTKLKYRDDFD